MTRRRRAALAQLAEASGSNPVQSRFESEGRHLHLINGGRQEAEAIRRLYPYEARKVRAELPPDGPVAA